MYVKLIAPATISSSWYYIRDICRLLTASTPSVSLLTAFTSSSVVVDSTAAGWTYVGSTLAADRPTPSTSVSDAIVQPTPEIWALSAPCLEGSALKYITLSPATPNMIATTLNQLVNLTGARSVTSLGVATNEGIRVYTTNSTTTNYTFCSQTAMQFAASSVIHLIATARGICIIPEGKGLQAVWETSMTDVHRFYSTAPVCVWQNGGGMDAQNQKTTILSSVIPQVSGVGQNSGSFASCVLNITDPNTGTVYGPVEAVQGGLSAGVSNAQNWYQASPYAMRANSIDSTGLPKYQVSPIYVQPGQYGYPSMYVTGVFNAYWTKPLLGNTGDTVAINGDYYTFFNCGSAMLGILMKLS